MIEAIDLTRVFGERTALRGIRCTIRPGEITGCLGPNGAGKSTLLKSIVGLLPPTSGHVSVCGFDVVQSPLEARRRIGYVPESGGLYQTLTPHEYLSLVAELHGLEREVAAERIANLLDAMQVSDAGDRQIDTLSKGMRQKVLIIAALLHDPEVLLLDEATDGLDAHATLTFHEILSSLAASGKTIFYCSHAIDSVERLCSRVLVLHEGELVADDSVAVLLGAGQRTLEAAFRKLTKREGADEAARAFVEALKQGSTAPPSGPAR